MFALSLQTWAPFARGGTGGDTKKGDGRQNVRLISSERKSGLVVFAPVCCQVATLFLLG